MRDPVGQLVKSLKRRGVSLEMTTGKLRVRGSITFEERRVLTINAPIVACILSPDKTLPDVLVIPAATPNTNEAIEACVNAQRVGLKGRITG